MSSPSDPVCPASALCWAYDTDEYVAVVSASQTRGQARSYAASEWGLRFLDVCVRVIYARIFTRQEAWESYGADTWQDRWTFERHLGYYLPAAGLPHGEGWYEDDAVAFWQEGERERRGGLRMVNVRTPPRKVTVPNPPPTVPDGWEPDEHDPCWSETHRLDGRPHVHKFWLCEA